MLPAGARSGQLYLVPLASFEPPGPAMEILLCFVGKHLLNECASHVQGYEY